MEVTLYRNFSIELKDKVQEQAFDKLNEVLELYFKDKSYGESVQTYFITVICVHPKFDFFTKEAKPKYIEDKKKTVIKIFGEIHIYREFSFDLTLNFNEFINSTPEDALRMVANEVLQKIRVMQYPKMIKDFDSKAFLADLELFFKEEGVLK